MVKNDQEILKKRARMITGMKTEKDSSVDSILAVEFLLIPERYAIDCIYVSEVMFLRNLTPIPGTPSSVMGIVNIRGKIISVVNLKSFFNLKEKGISALNKIMIVKHQQMEFGIITDEITGTRQLELKTLSPPPETLHGPGADYVQGITPDGVILLDALTILSSHSIIINQK